MRLEVEGRFFRLDGQRVALQGVTLGPFPPDCSLTAELEAIAASGARMVRVYEAPSEDFLDEAQRLGLVICASVPWEWGADFISDRSLQEDGYQKIRAFLTDYAEHPALGVVYIANEIPASLVRWMDPLLVKQALEELIDRLRAEFPQVLYAYANYPTTEYLELSNADFTAFNLYLECEEELRSYLRHLHCIAGHRPLVISEYGVDAGRRSMHGEPGQTRLLTMALEVMHTAGCQGMTIFSWSDLWWNRSQLIKDWKFGLHRTDGSVRTDPEKLFDPTLPESERYQGLCSIVVCSYNGSARIAPCLEAITQLRDSSYEVVVIDDGSTDETAGVARGFQALFSKLGVSLRVITQRNQGLSVARNAGAELANGGWVVYTDDDARPDQDWLYWLRREIGQSERVGMVGGYGMQPMRDSAEAQMVSQLPGQACPVLRDYVNAEHLPGCNMAVRKEVWQEVQGFRARYRVAGDDVDFCWRVLDAGYQVRFAPNAYVWHESRATIRAYVKQQWGYGKAEALLYHDHPQRFDDRGIQWSGAIYSGASRALGARSVIYTGWAQSAPFQFIVSGEAYAQPMGLMGWFLAKVHPYLRLLSRWAYGVPITWDALLPSFEARERTRQVTGLVKEYWSAEIRSRQEVMGDYLEQGWCMVDDKRWDLRKGDRLLRFVLEQPGVDGQRLKVEETVVS